MLTRIIIQGTCLLQFREGFARLMAPQSLFRMAGIAWILISAVIITIYSRLYYRKKAHLYKLEIRESLQQWVSETILAESETSPLIPKKYFQIVKNPVGRQFVTDELINSKKNFTGVQSLILINLYEQLGLKKFSLKKLNSAKWHIKARGIQELYLMDQGDALKRIYKNTNNRHEFVRMEAQTGLIHLFGFEGLRFLDIISYPMTEWQQIKLLESLGRSKVNIKLNEAIPKWLRSQNDTVVVFALKLADEYQQLSLHDVILSSLQHPNEIVRRQAIKTLVRIADETTARIMTVHFPAETFANQLSILEALGKIGSEEQCAFLTGMLNDENNIIKLRAAKALALSSANGLPILAGKSREQPFPYEEIYLHVKSETSI